MPNTPPPIRSDLQEVKTRNIIARGTLSAVADKYTGLSRMWERIYASLADIPRLVSEITDLRIEVKTVRLARANLAAAARATLAAHRDGEPDALSYVRDELTAQGWHNGGRQ